MTRKYQIVICGAGITGISAAYYLARAGFKDVLLLDERPPLTLTSDRSTECYRNWWSDAEMLALMNRSIDLMEQLADESGNIFHMNRRGYLYVTADDTKIHNMIQRSARIGELGAGKVWIHSSNTTAYQPAHPEGFHDEPTGVDVLLGNDLIRKHFPYLTEKAVAALHIRRAGWLSAQQMGMYLLETAKQSGVQFETGCVEAINTTNGRISGIKLSTGQPIDCKVFINAAGPYLKSVGNLLGLDLPVHTELHLKVAVKDSLGVIRRDAPLLIWDDPQYLPWSDGERESLADDPDAKWLTESLPSGAHTRPEGAGESQNVLMLWEYKTRPLEPTFPLPLDDQFPEIALRGLVSMLPGLQGYFNKMPKPQLDGGYYTKTRENRLLVGPLPVDGAYVIGAVSGYGIMSACAAGDLLTAHIAGTKLPSYAAAFSPSRYDDPEYQKKLENWGDSGQL
ncbi:MAG TPA: FAD-binding oxidoreductase [Anaerolineales bacterium]|nr:FAD-binding oxidoreductase [Anaerolineales bacterium]